MKLFNFKKNKNIIMSNLQIIKQNMNNFIKITKNLSSIKKLWIYYIKNIQKLPQINFQVKLIIKYL